MSEASKGSVGTRTTMSIGTGSSAFACQITDITLPNVSRESVKVSHMNSAAHEFLPGKLADYGSLKADILFEGVAPSFDSDDLLSIEIVIPIRAGARKCTFQGFITGFDPKIPMEGEMSASITIKVSGKVTYAAV